MTVLKTALLLIALLIWPLFEARAENFKARLLGGGGYTNTNYDFPGRGSFNYHYGIQLLNTIPNDPSQRAWGIEISDLHAFGSDAGDFKYLMIGVMVERKFFGFLLGQLSTAAYIGRNDINKRNPAGFRTAVGPEWAITKDIAVSVLFRQDLILDEKRISALSVETGIGFKF